VFAAGLDSFDVEPMARHMPSMGEIHRSLPQLRLPR